MNKRTKILHCLGSMNHGGIESWLMQVFRYIDHSQFEIHICCFSGELGVYAPELKAMGIHIFACQLTRNLYRFNQEFDQILRRENYDVVHSHVHAFSGYILWRAAKADVPIRIAHSHTSPPPETKFWRKLYRKWMASWIKKYATQGLGVSPQAMTCLFGEDWQANPHHQILYYGIDLERFEPQHIVPLREVWQIPPHGKVIGHVGRLVLAKNHHFLLQIVQQVQQLEPDVWLVLVGDGPLRPELELAVQAMGMSQVVFVGASGQVPSFMYLFDMMLFPSFYEGLPVTILEAQAAGLPCVCSTAVPVETVVWSESVQRLNLNAPIAEWVENCKIALNTPRLAANAALSQIIDSPYHITNSAQSLALYYSNSELN